jgi:cyanophycinase-like exopeptidase
LQVVRQTSVSAAIDAKKMAKAGICIHWPTAWPVDMAVFFGEHEFHLF